MSRAAFFVIQNRTEAEFKKKEEEDIEIDYKEFEDIAGEHCDWCYTEIKCPECNGKCEIEAVYFD
jgi:hypothetical protein